MDSSSRIGVVTVTYNSGSVIDDFMVSLLAQTHRVFTAYIIDNASSDDTVKRVGAYRDRRIRLLEQKANVGVAEGNNIGILAALNDSSEYILLINNDTVFGANLLTELLDGLERYCSDMVTPKILYFDDPKRIWCAGGYFSRLRGSARHFGIGRLDEGEFDHPRAVDYSPTCCMLIKKNVFADVGLMDSNYFVYFDDTDFCQRAYRAGIHILYLPAARLLHKVSALIGGESDFYYWITIRNHVYYLLKHFRRWQIPLYLAAYQIHLLLKFVVLLRKPKTFLLAERAFLKGISLFRAASSSLGGRNFQAADQIGATLLTGRPGPGSKEERRQLGSRKSMVLK